MKTALPKFEGRVVTAAGIRLSGSTHERVGCLGLDEEVYFVIRGTVSKVTHQDGTGDLAGTFVRLHAVKAVDVFCIEEHDGRKMLDEAQMLNDERFGVQGLFDRGEDEK